MDRGSSLTGTTLLLQYFYAEAVEEYMAVINVRRRDTSQIDSPEDLQGRIEYRPLALACFFLVLN